MFNKLLLFPTLALLLIMAAIVPASAKGLKPLNDGEQVIPAKPEPLHVDEMVTVIADEATGAKRQALLNKIAKANLPPEEQTQALAQLVAFDQQRISDWAHSLKFVDGRAFTRELSPTHIVDKRLTAFFPETYFYAVMLPGYFGGAAPTEEILRSYDLPAVLQTVNIFAIGKTAELSLLTGLQSRTQYFQQESPKVLTMDAARQAAACWLILYKQYIWQFYQQPQFSIDETLFPVTELFGNVMNLDVVGKAVAIPDSGATGEIIVKMRFDFKGKLQFAEEKQQLEFAPILLPPATVPGLLPAIPVID